MKIRAATLRIYQQVHTWSGLLAGLALFIAFYAGALSIFRSDIDRWQSPPWGQAQTGTLSVQALVDRLVHQVPTAGEDFGLMLPDGGSAPYAFWFAQGKTHYLTAESAALPSDHGPSDRLADFIYALHYSLGASTPGLYLMGVASLLYGLALVSGVILHLPGLVQQLFALRPGHNLKRLWTDAHNAIGVLSLPFHIIFALTGALFCLSSVVLVLLGKVAFGPQLATQYAQALAPTPIQMQHASAAPKPTLPVAILLQHAKAEAAAAGSPGFEPTYLHYVHYGRADAQVEVTGIQPRSIAIYGSLHLGADDGRLLAAGLGRYASLNQSVSSAMYGLHFGNFGGRTVQWLYFVLGLAGAFLFYSGNLLWLESRRRRRHVEQPRRVRFMARTTLGICLGSCLGISVAFAAAWLAALAGLKPGHVVAISFFSTLAASGLYAGWRAVPVAAQGLCKAIAWVSGITAGLHLLYSLLPAWRDASPAGSSVLAVDLVGLGLALGFASLARATRRRALAGDPNSIWSAMH